jgi:hypothetical protein
MREELDKQLTNAFPLLYANRYLKEYRDPISFGFEVHDGWFDLIYKLSEKLEPLIRQYIIAHKDDPDNLSYIQLGQTWWPTAIQVKEKFGTLRFYMSECTDEMSRLIDEAESLSGTICDICGKPGEVTNSSGYRSTRYPIHK